ncbi:hypothetical protein MKW94_014762, partial [Papaver nudicaule]|nr:hypothetical protein [Papaver nudicaule]
MPPKTDTRHFRSTLGPTIEATKVIRAKIKGKPKHLEAMEKCPFWGFYRPFHEGRINLKDMTNTQKGLELILNTFDDAKQVFKINGKEFEATPEQLAVILGLQRTNGVDKYDLKHPTHEVLAAQVVFRETYLKGAASPRRGRSAKNKKKRRGEIKKADILESLYATADDVTKLDDFVKLLVLWLCASIFLNSQNGFQLAEKFLSCVFAMDQVSWPDLIHSYLLEALQKAKKPIKEIKGCTIFILFWFAEITHFIGKIEGEQGQSKPRFARWNTKVLAKSITDLGMTSLGQDLPGSFIDPFDEDEQKLITPTEIHPAIESDEDLESTSTSAQER